MQDTNLYLQNKNAYSVKMFGMPYEDLKTEDMLEIESLLMNQSTEPLILSSLGWPGCVIYIESPYDSDDGRISELEDCWKRFSAQMQELILHCQNEGYTWLRLCP
jgi:hypothetical protein